MGRGVLGRRYEGNWTMPRNAASERCRPDSERHQGGVEDGQEADFTGQGAGCGKVAARIKVGSRILIRRAGRCYALSRHNSHATHAYASCLITNQDRTGHYSRNARNNPALHHLPRT